MKQAHTHFPKGRTVWVRLKNGEEYTGKFVERKGRFVYIDELKFTTKEIKAMGFSSRRDNLAAPWEGSSQRGESAEYTNKAAGAASSNTKPEESL